MSTSLAEPDVCVCVCACVCVCVFMLVCVCVCVCVCVLGVFPFAVMLESLFYKGAELWLSSEPGKKNKKEY